MIRVARSSGAYFALLLLALCPSMSQAQSNSQTGPSAQTDLFVGNWRFVPEERVAILFPEDHLSPASIPLEIRQSPGPEARSNLQDTRESAERASIVRVLEQTNWNVSSAARVLGIERTNLHKKIRALGISKAK